MPLSSLSKYAAYIAIALNLAACSYFLPNTTPTLGGLLAAKGDTRPFEVPLPVNTEPKRMALSSMFTIGVKADGTVWSWGSGTEGELGMGKKENRPTPQAIPNMTNFIEVAAGYHHVLALRKDGTVWSWGNNKTGALGYKEEGVPWGIAPEIRYDPYQLSPRQIPDLKDIVSIAAGSDFSLALDKEGRVWGWGSESYILNNKANREDIRKTPTVVYENKSAVKVVASSFDSAVLTKNGEGIVWKNVYPSHSKVMPILLSSLFEKSHEPIVDIVFSPAYGDIYVLTNDGFVYAQGFNSEGGLGDGTFTPRKTFVKVKNIGRIKAITNAMAMDEKGRLWRWGGGIYWRPNIVGFNSNREPYPINIFTSKSLIFVTADNGSAALGLDNGEVRFLLRESVGIRGTGKPSPQYESSKHLLTPEKSLWTWK